MIFWGQIRVDKIKFEQIITLPNFTFGQLFMWIGANNDQIWLPMGYVSDSEQCSNRLELYLILLLVNFSCDLGQIMTTYDFLWARWVILSNVRTNWTWSNFIFGQLFMWIGANMSDSEQCSNRLELDLISLLVNFSCEFGQIMTRYDFLWARWVLLSHVRTDLNLT